MAQQTFVLSCVVFLSAVLLLPSHPFVMFSVDTPWHLAAGDLIRQLGHIPAHDAWSFTAGQTPWVNISWSWDMALSYAYEHFGWQGVIAFNSITVAATLALIFATASLRAGNAIDGFIATLLVAFTVLPMWARPMQVTFLFTAATNLLLWQVSRGACKKCWLALCPALMVIWVNCHGGFLVGFFLIAAYSAKALAEKNRPLLYALLAAGACSLLACAINPYGLNLALTTWHVLFCVANPIIAEWKPITLSGEFLHVDFYLLLFVTLVLLRPTPLSVFEKTVACIWLVLSLGSMRHINIFGILSAPLLAVGINSLMGSQRYALPLARPRTLCGLAALLAFTTAAWLFTPQATGLYRTASLKPVMDLSAEISFIETHAPHAHLITDFDLGGALIFEARGKVPLFVDGRTESAYPPQLLLDYMAFYNGEQGWESMLERYHIEGALIANGHDDVLDRLAHRRGWRVAFTGPAATLLLRDR